MRGGGAALMTPRDLEPIPGAYSGFQPCGDDGADWFLVRAGTAATADTGAESACDDPIFVAQRVTANPSGVCQRHRRALSRAAWRVRWSRSARLGAFRAASA